MGLTELLKTLGANSPTVALIIFYGWFLLHRIQNQERVSEKARSDIKGMLYKIKGKTDDLHDWHNVTNPDGSRPWMNSGMERSFNRIADEFKEQNKINRDMMKEQSEVMRIMVEKLNWIASKVNA